MRLAPTCRNQRPSQANGKWKVGLAVAMEVSDFAFIESKLYAAETVGADLHAIPVGDDVDDCIFNFLVWHVSTGRMIMVRLARGRMRGSCQLAECMFSFEEQFDCTIRVAMATEEL
jgi:hypothetical protein